MQKPNVSKKYGFWSDLKTFRPIRMQNFLNCNISQTNGIMKMKFCWWLDIHKSNKFTKSFQVGVIRLAWECPKWWQVSCQLLLKLRWVVKLVYGMWLVIHRCCRSIQSFQECGVGYVQSDSKQWFSNISRISWSLKRIFCLLLGIHDPIHTESTKHKIMDLSFQNVIKWSKLYGSLRKKNWSCRNNDTLNLRRNDANCIISQEVVGLQSDQKIVAKFIWITTLMLSCS